MKREEFSLARGFVAFGVAVALVCDAVSGWNQRQFLREAAPANAAPEQDSGQLEEPLLVLVNGENAVPGSWWFLPYLVDDEVVDRRMAEDLSALLEAAESRGVWLWVASGYRSRRRQEDILESAVQERMAQGLSREQARAKALETIAQPGHSEHETGLALDFNDVSQGFQETEAYQWLRQHGAAYGFIQRYQREKEAVTGVKAEPWHFRYVGREHALAMERLGLCLEEYVRWQRALGGPYKNAALSCQTAPGCAIIGHTAQPRFLAAGLRNRASRWGAGIRRE